MHSRDATHVPICTCGFFATCRLAARRSDDVGRMRARRYALIMLDTCASCPGLLPLGLDACPHCGAKIGRRAATLRAIAGAFAAGGMAVTLMACYGMPAGSEGTDCDTDNDCWEGLACGDDGYCHHVPVCGDGHLDEGEACDDGGEVAGDGCDTVCAIELDAFCAALPELLLGDLTNDVVSAGATAIFTGSCLDQPGSERAYRFTAPQAGTLNIFFDQTHEHGIYILSDCAPNAPELGCVYVRGSVNTPLAAGEQVIVVVEGIDSSNYTIDTQFSPM
ncbi:MAG: hypothetical protein HOV80_10545 [Polyangiaceae bacterium]|nr:hypothetical protein [Polyangiaceae bacterium]